MKHGNNSQICTVMTVSKAPLNALARAAVKKLKSTRASTCSNVIKESCIARALARVQERLGAPPPNLIYSKSKIDKNVLPKVVKNDNSLKQLNEIESLRTRESAYNFKKRLYTSYSKFTEVKLITIGIASPLRILQWAEKTLPNGKIYGEVLNANTLHHKTFKPQKGGLFCERIFGPLKDFECACGKIDKTTKRLTLPSYEHKTKMNGKQNNEPALNLQETLEVRLAGPERAQAHGQKNNNQKNIKLERKLRKFCPDCDVEYTWSVIRRYQLGYVKLISPVIHVWFLKGTPSYLSIILDMKKRHLQSVTYCSETLTIEHSDLVTNNLKSFKRSEFELDSASNIYSSWMKARESDLLIKKRSDSSGIESPPKLSDSFVQETHVNPIYKEDVSYAVEETLFPQVSTFSSKKSTVKGEAFSIARVFKENAGSLFWKGNRESQRKRVLLTDKQKRLEKIKKLEKTLLISLTNNSSDIKGKKRTYQVRNNLFNKSNIYVVGGAVSSRPSAQAQTPNKNAIINSKDYHEEDLETVRVFKENTESPFWRRGEAVPERASTSKTKEIEKNVSIFYSICVLQMIDIYQDLIKNFEAEIPFNIQIYLIQKEFMEKQKQIIQLPNSDLVNYSLTQNSLMSPFYEERNEPKKILERKNKSRRLNLISLITKKLPIDLYIKSKLEMKLQKKIVSISILKGWQEIYKKSFFKALHKSSSFTFTNVFFNQNFFDGGALGEGALSTSSPSLLQSKRETPRFQKKSGLSTFSLKKSRLEETKFSRLSAETQRSYDTVSAAMNRTTDRALEVSNYYDLESYFKRIETFSDEKSSNNLKKIIELVKIYYKKSILFAFRNCKRPILSNSFRFKNTDFAIKEDIQINKNGLPPIPIVLSFSETLNQISNRLKNIFNFDIELMVDILASKGFLVPLVLNQFLNEIKHSLISNTLFKTTHVTPTLDRISENLNFYKYIDNDFFVLSNNKSYESGLLTSVNIQETFSASMSFNTAGEAPLDLKGNFSQQPNTKRDSEKITIETYLRILLLSKSLLKKNKRSRLAFSSETPGLVYSTRAQARAQEPASRIVNKRNTFSTTDFSPPLERYSNFEFSNFNLDLPNLIGNKLLIDELKTNLSIIAVFNYHNLTLTRTNNISSLNAPSRMTSFFLTTRLEKNAGPLYFQISEFFLQSALARSDEAKPDRQKNKIKEVRVFKENAGSLFCEAKDTVAVSKGNRESQRNRVSLTELFYLNYLNNFFLGDTLKSAQKYFGARTRTRVLAMPSLSTQTRKYVHNELSSKKASKKRIYNNIYTLSHRERWGGGRETNGGKDWQIFSFYNAAYSTDKDQVIYAYKERLSSKHRVFEENAVEGPLYNSQINSLPKNLLDNTNPLANKTPPAFQRNAGSGNVKNNLSIIEPNTSASAPQFSYLDNATRKFILNRSSGIRNKQNYDGLINNSFFSGPGVVQQLLTELNFSEMKKLDKQNRLVLYILNKSIFRLKKQIKLFLYDKTAQAEMKELCKKRDLLIRRTKLVRKLFRKNTEPSSMILTVLPVLPPDLRPIVKMGGQIAASDLNRFYQRVIYRNDRLKKFLKDPATSNSYEMKYAQRLLQESVDNLMQNSQNSGEKDSRGRVLKSLSDILKGKQGRFRQFLLGKRVDYSGRSVIVVGPKLKLYECGIPLEMALELYLPFLLKAILNKNYSKTVVGAKALIKNNRPLACEILREIMQVTPVLLNRAPTLHRLGFQAFVPRLVEGRAILLHPLVCSSFNADFDGDQMAVHVPITIEARAEAWKLMLSRNNILSPATGDPLAIPSQDMILGCYYLTTNSNKRTIPLLRGSGLFFNNLEKVLYAYNMQKIDLHASVWVKWLSLIENGNDQEEPVEIRISVYGHWQELSRNYIRYYNNHSMLINQFISTTPGRIIFDNLIHSIR